MTGLILGSLIPLMSGLTGMIAECPVVNYEYVITDRPRGYIYQYCDGQAKIIIIDSIAMTYERTTR